MSTGMVETELDESSAWTESLLSFNCRPNEHVLTEKLVPPLCTYVEPSGHLFNQDLRAAVAWDGHGAFWPERCEGLAQKMLVAPLPAFDGLVLALGLTPLFDMLARRADAPCLRVARHMVGPQRYECLSRNLDSLAGLSASQPVVLVNAFNLLQLSYFRGVLMLERALAEQAKAAVHRLQIKTQHMRTKLDKVMGGAGLGALQINEQMIEDTFKFWRTHEAQLWA